MTNRDIDAINEGICMENCRESYYEIYKDLWNFHLTFSNFLLDLDEAEMLTAAKKLCEKYNHSEFCKSMLAAIIMELYRGQGR